MNRNNNDPSNNNEQSPRHDADPADDYRREPQFSRFDDDDGYEEPDRDTDLASDYRADSTEEEDYEDELPDEDERGLFSAGDAESPDESASPDAEDSETWLEKDAYPEEEQGGRNWPLGLVAMAVVALALLVAGGYGVMQQRAAAQEEIRQLRAALATSASPEDVNASRTALQEMKQSFDQLSATAEAMKLENRRLADTVAGLEAQLGAQQAVLTKPVHETGQAKAAPAADSSASRPATTQPVAPTTTKPAAPASVAPSPPTKKTAAEQPAATESAAGAPAAATSGPWFVNFGSYVSSNMAESWARKLHPAAGKVVVLPFNKDGQTLYRVRVLGLPDRNSAQEVAHALEAQLRVSALWVGKD